MDLIPVKYAIDKLNSVANVEMRNYDPPAWAITQRGGLVMDKKGDWEYEPLPSNRSQRFIKRTRWSTADKALAAYARAVKEQ